MIDCFIPFSASGAMDSVIGQFLACKEVKHVFLMTKDVTQAPVEGCSLLFVDNLDSASTYRQIALVSKSEFTVVYTKQTPVLLGYRALERMTQSALQSGAMMVYSDHYAMKAGEQTKSPAIPYQLGSVRNDFDFGSLCLYRTQMLKEYVREFPDSRWSAAGGYEVRLFASRSACHGIMPIYYINEYLYTEEENDLRRSGEKQFDYVDPRNHEVQKEMEAVCTDHLKKIGAYVDAGMVSDIAVEAGNFDCEVSVIIPVRNRVKTIEDAIMSALSQRTQFRFNIIVVDNYSDDGTTEAIDKIANCDERVIHVIPEEINLGIGGCWDLAIRDPRCGRFAVQLDSDDLYSREDTLQLIVDKFYEEKCAMVIGSYRMCDFHLRTLPPGIIDHREWTDANGRNNTLRINGLGAPRAFYTPLLRTVGFPNTSYGEDYALGLALSRQYRIGRIFDELYLCRRWDGNSDAALSVEKVNINNYYKDSLRTMEIRSRQQMNEYWSSAASREEIDSLFDMQLSVWTEAAERYRRLADVKVRPLLVDDFSVDIQFNPSRIVSTGADIADKTIRRRACFLCQMNLPSVQKGLPLTSQFQILVNPYPILPKHFTIPIRQHRPQAILDHFADMMRITAQLENMLVFYNGPLCGASAPDHMHFQAGSRGVVPLERDYSRNPLPEKSGIYPLNWICKGYVLISDSADECDTMFRQVYETLPIPEGQAEPMMNVLSWMQEGRYVCVIIPRRKHRPECYQASGSECTMISPGALDMAGYIITPREEDYRKISPDMIRGILCEVGC